MVFVCIEPLPHRQQGPRASAIPVNFVAIASRNLFQISPYFRFIFLEQIILWKTNLSHSSIKEISHLIAHSAQHILNIVFYPAVRDPNFETFPSEYPRIMELTFRSDMVDSFIPLLLKSPNLLTVYVISSSGKQFSDVSSVDKVLTLFLDNEFSKKPRVLFQTRDLVTKQEFVYTQEKYEIV